MPFAEVEYADELRDFIWEAVTRLRGKPEADHIFESLALRFEIALETGDVTAGDLLGELIRSQSLV